MAAAEDSVRLARLEERQEALIRGLAQMNETLALHGAMLERILQAASQPPPKSELAGTLRRIAAILVEQGGTLAALDNRLADLPERLAEAIRGGDAQGC